MHISTKTYGHEIGLSCCFRQWRAKSHCRHLHGYALSVRLEFEAKTLDENNWVIDFGSLKGFKGWLESTFDHKLLVAEDDPHKDMFCELARFDLADVIVVEQIGCEAFAEMIYKAAEKWLFENEHAHRVKMRMVEVKEHGANSGIFNNE